MMSPIYTMWTANRILAVGLYLVLNLVLVWSIPQVDISISITEEVLNMDSLITNLRDESRIRELFSSEEINEIYFQFLSDEPEGFTVESGGAIKTTDWIDRDSRCPNMQICEVKFDLAIQPTKYFTLIKVTILIDDINDHTPEFEEDTISRIVSETVQRQSSFALPALIDPDSPKYSVASVKLQPPSDTFELTSKQKPDGTQERRLVLIKSLDRETTSEYHLQVVAWDGGIPPKSGTLDINIAVSDANDNHPEFDEDTYEVDLPENSDSGTRVVQVHAEDLDTGLNGHIVYRLSDDTASSLGHIFKVDAQTGEVTVIGEVDYETSQTLYLTVEAHDQGADPVPGETVVVINVQDVNDHAPHIIVHTLGGPGVEDAEVPEDAESGTFVARVVVSDEDQGDNGHYDCSLQEERFILAPLGADFLITTHGELDRERQAQYNLAVVCQDHGWRSLSSVSHIRVRVKDINDNPPHIPESIYFRDIIENNIPNTKLITLNATDPDEGSNAEIRFSIQAPESRWFSIDQLTGVLSVVGSMDHEVQPRYEVTVVASDRGHPSMSATTTVIVSVLDINDEAPSFSQEIYTFGVFENELAGTEVGYVQADDPDGYPYNIVIFSMQSVEPSMSTSPFQIATDTGRITTSQSLDREHNSVYTIVTVATDHSPPYFSSSATVSVYIMDRNDNPPRFLFPTENNNTVYIGNDVPVGYIITKVIADDRDGDSDGQVVYEMVQNTDKGGYFTVDPYLGTVNLVNSLQHIDNATFSLKIIASDSGDMTMSTSSTLNIVVDKDLAGVYEERASNSGMVTNVIIVISVACLSGVLIVALILAIVFLCRKKHQFGNRQIRHKCRMDALKQLTSKEAGTSSQESSFEKESSPKEDDRKVSEETKIYERPTPTEIPPKPNILDLSMEKSRQWLEHIKEAEERNVHATPIRRDVDNESVNSGLGSNTDSGRGPSEHGDMVSRPPLEGHYPYDPHKDIGIDISKYRQGPARSSFHVNPNRPNPPPYNSARASFHGGRHFPGNHRPLNYRSQSYVEPPKIPDKVKFVKGDVTDQIQIQTTPRSRQNGATGIGQSTLIPAPPKPPIIHGTNPSINKHAYLGNKPYAPIMYARCHGNVNQTSSPSLVSNSHENINSGAHGYHSNKYPSNQHILKNSQLKGAQFVTSDQGRSQTLAGLPGKDVIV